MIPSAPPWLDDFMVVRPIGPNFDTALAELRVAPGHRDWTDDLDRLERSVCAGDVVSAWTKFSWLLFAYPSAARIAALLELHPELPRNDPVLVRVAAGQLYRLRPLWHETDRGIQVFGTTILRAAADHGLELLEGFHDRVATGTDPAIALERTQDEITTLERDLDLSERSAQSLRTAVRAATAELEDVLPTVLFHAHPLPTAHDTVDLLRSRFSPHVLMGSGTQWSVMPRVVARPPVGVPAGALTPSDRPIDLTSAARLWAPNEPGELNCATHALDIARAIAA